MWIELAAFGLVFAIAGVVYVLHRREMRKVRRERERD
jgi:uncharacterized protein YjeT (DUF2065 family)